MTIFKIGDQIRRNNTDADPACVGCTATIIGLEGNLARVKWGLPGMMSFSDGQGLYKISELPELFEKIAAKPNDWEADLELE